MYVKLKLPLFEKVSEFKMKYDLSLQVAIRSEFMSEAVNLQPKNYPGT